MKHSGKAGKAAFRLILLSLVAVIVVWGLGSLTTAAVVIIAGIAWAALPFVLIGWGIFALFTFYFFRDPHARTPAEPNCIVSPAHGKVDVIDTTSEAQFMGGPCQRVSIFLSVFDVHVQNAPASGKVAFFKYTTGQFLNAMKTDSAVHNENVLLGFDCTEPAGKKIGVRLIAGLIARRIVPWVEAGERVVRGERISLIQFGSRADLYLPADATITVKLGDKVVGGETILAKFH